MHNPALIVIDAQREYFDADSPLVIPTGPETLTRIASLVETCRQQGVPVIHVRHEEAAGGGVFEPGTDNVAIMPDVEPGPTEPVILKHLPGAFDNTDLAAVLQRLDARTVIISGFMTHMCCDTTARQAQARGFEVVFVSDATATRDLASPTSGALIPHQQVHEATLAAQADGFASIKETAGVASELRDGGDG
jgi:nicotinamidase-related amidase